MERKNGKRRRIAAVLAVAALATAGPTIVFAVNAPSRPHAAAAGRAAAPGSNAEHSI